MEPQLGSNSNVSRFWGFFQTPELLAQGAHKRIPSMNQHMLWRYLGDEKRAFQVAGIIAGRNIQYQGSKYTPWYWDIIESVVNRIQAAILELETDVPDLAIKMKHLKETLVLSWRIALVCRLIWGDPSLKDTKALIQVNDKIKLFIYDDRSNKIQCTTIPKSIHARLKINALIRQFIAIIYDGIYDSSVLATYMPDVFLKESDEHEEERIDLH